MNIKPPSVTEWFRSTNLDNYIDFDKDAERKLNKQGEYGYLDN